MKAEEQEKLEKSKQQMQSRKLEIVAVSDTHSSYEILDDIANTMSGDIFIHAGDFTSHGRGASFKQFFKCLDRIKLKFKHVVVISGNHEIILDDGQVMTAKSRDRFLQKYPCDMTRQEVLTELRTRCIYLEHSSVTIEGISIFGSPYTPSYCHSAFQYSSKISERQLWEQIPENVDLLITHGPPYGICDLTRKEHNAGSPQLRRVCLKRKPKYHIFGHIHEGQGMDKLMGTVFVNVAKQPTRLLYSL